MGGRQNEQGFTVVEMITTLVVLTIFLTLFFQLFLTIQSQQLASARRAAANDIAAANLGKIVTRAQIPGGDPSPCNNGSTKQIASDEASRTASWTPPTIGKEDLSGSPLSASSTFQILTATYPRACGANEIAQITSVVKYQSLNGTETITRSKYVD